MNKGQQALNTLREKGYTNHFQPITLEQQYPNEFKTLQKLVDRATPKKTIYIDATLCILSHFICPVCRTKVSRNGLYCDSCGQALDWSDEDDK